MAVGKKNDVINDVPQFLSSAELLQAAQQAKEKGLKKDRDDSPFHVVNINGHHCLVRKNSGPKVG